MHCDRLRRPATRDIVLSLTLTLTLTLGLGRLVEELLRMPEVLLKLGRGLTIGEHRDLLAGEFAALIRLLGERLSLCLTGNRGKLLFILSCRCNYRDR